MSTLRAAAGACMLVVLCFSAVSAVLAPTTLGVLSVVFYAAAMGFFIAGLREEAAARRRLLDTVEDRLTRPGELVDL